MTPLQNLHRPLRSEAEARSNVIRLHPIVPEPHPPEPTFEQRLQATVVELWRRKWLLLAALACVGWLAFVVASEGSEPVPVARYVEPTEWAQFGFRASFDAADDVPRWSEISL